MGIQGLWTNIFHNHTTLLWFKFAFCETIYNSWCQRQNNPNVQLIEGSNFVKMVFWPGRIVPSNFYGSYIIQGINEFLFEQITLEIISFVTWSLIIISFGICIDFNHRAYCFFEFALVFSNVFLQQLGSLVIIFGGFVSGGIVRTSIRTIIILIRLG